MPWLFGNILAGLTCAAIANTFQIVLQTAIILAMFIPLVLTLSESISIQAMAMSINILHAKKVRFKDVLNRIAIESKTAMLLGLTAGLVVEFLAIILHTNELPFLVISVSIFTSMTLTSCLGVLLPVILHQLRLDPKIAGGPVVLMFADVVATESYVEGKILHWNYHSALGEVGEATQYYPDKNEKRTDPNFNDINPLKALFLKSCCYLCTCFISECSEKKWIVQKGEFFHCHPSLDQLINTEKYPDSTIDTYTPKERTELLFRINKCVEHKINFAQTSSHIVKNLLDEEHNNLKELVLSYNSSNSEE